MKPGVDQNTSWIVYWIVNTCWLQAEFDTVLEMVVFSFRGRAEEVSRDSQVTRLRKDLEEARSRRERVERVSGRLFTVVITL